MNDLSVAAIREKLRQLTEEFGITHGVEELQRRFLQLQAVLQFSLDGHLLSTEAGEILLANPAVTKMLGYEGNELLQKKGHDIFDVHDPEIAQMLQIRAQTGRFTGEIKLISKSGQKIAVEVSSVRFEVDQTYYNSVYVRDLQTVVQERNSRQQSEKYLAMLMANTDESFFLLDNDLNIVYFNKKASLESQRWLKIEPEVGMSIYRLSPAHTLKELEQTYAEVLCGIKKEAERFIPLPNGERMWYKSTYTPLYDDQGQIAGVFVSIIDSTQAREAEEKFLKQKALFEALIQTTSDGIVILDVDTTIRFANQTSQEIIGYGADKLIGIQALDLVHPDDRNEAAEALNQLLLKPEQLQFAELRLINQEKQSVWCEFKANNKLSDPHIGGLVVHIHSIHARKMAELALVESKRSLETLLNHTEESFMLFDRKLNIVSFNKAANARNLLIHGKPIEQGGSLLKMIKPERIPFVRDFTRKVLQSGETQRTIAEYQLDTGSLLILELEYSAVKEPDGNISGICLIGNDITERRLASKALLESRERLLEAAHIAKLGYWDYDFEADIVSWSNELFGLYGLDPTVFSPSAEGFYAVVHPLDVDRLREQVQLVIAAKIPELNFQHRIVMRNGEIRWIQQRGKLQQTAGKIWLTGTAQDISLQKSFDQERELLIERFRLVEMATNDVIWDLDYLTDTLLWSGSLERAFGYPIADKKQYNIDWWISKIHPDERALVAESFLNHRFTKNRQWIAEYRFEDVHGEYHDVLDRGYTVFDVDGNSIRLIGSMQDITETVTHRRQLQASNDRLEGMVNSITDAFFTLDTHWRFSFMNAMAEQAFGEKAVEGDLWTAFPALQGSILEKQLKKAARTKKPLQFEALIFEDKWYDFNVYPQKSGVSVYARDISVRKREEQRLRLLESVVTNTKDAVVITEAEPISGEGPRIVYVNQAFTEMTGYTAAEVLGKTPRILQGPETSREVLYQIRQALEQWQDVEVELINYRKDGSPYWTNFSIFPLANKEGWYTNWISIQRNISARKETEQAQQLLNEELMRQNHGLEQFSYITSHNLRAPVANLLSLFDLLNRENMNDPGNPELIDMMHVSALRMEETLNELIKVLKIRGEINPVFIKINLPELYNRVHDSVKALIQEAGAKLSLNFSVTSFEYVPHHIESILLNMLTNAIKYRSPDRSLKINIDSSVVGEFVLLRFQDNGLGIDLDRYRNRLFGMYQRFHNNADSRGLGLYIVHAQVQALGGRIDVKSEVGRGTTFEVYLKTKKDARINH